MKFKKDTLFIVSLILTLMLSACGGTQGASSSEGGSGSDKKVVGVALSSVTDTFRTFVHDAMQAEAKKHPEFEFIFSDAQEDSTKQMSQIENFIAQDVDSIILMPVDTTVAPDMVSKANEVVFHLLL